MTETPKQAARRLLAGKIAKGYRPAALHEYTNADGQVIYYRARMEHPDGDAAPEGPEDHPVRYTSTVLDIGLASRTSRQEGSLSTTLNGIAPNNTALVVDFEG